jgi:hypothetical protein
LEVASHALLTDRAKALDALGRSEYDAGRLVRAGASQHHDLNTVGAPAGGYYPPLGDPAFALPSGSCLACRRATQVAALHRGEAWRGKVWWSWQGHRLESRCPLYLRRLGHTRVVLHEVGATPLRAELPITQPRAVRIAPSMCLPPGFLESSALHGGSVLQVAFWSKPSESLVFSYKLEFASHKLNCSSSASFH